MTATFIRRAALVTGGAHLLFGLVVMSAWTFRLTALLQFESGVAPEQFNTALAFALCGLAMGLIEWRRPMFHPTARLLALIATLLGAATIGEYLFRVNLGIDEIFASAYLMTGTSHPGRMSPQTALGVMLLGAALIAVTARRWKAAAAFGSIAATLGGLALAGYIVGLESAYGWRGLTAMSLQSATGVTILATAIVLLGFVDDGSDEDELAPRWTPIVMGFLSLGTMFVFWHLAMTVLMIWGGTATANGSRAALAVATLVGLLTTALAQIGLVASRHRRRAEAAQLQLERTVAELMRAETTVQELQTLLPLCAWCKRIRSDERDYWMKVEDYLGRFTNMEITHGLCPDCAKEMMSDVE
ncbi:MAG TPA: hypothetical protein VGY57_03575, partial [Vicinamibacterales bacterium]|nr:hypothetical protein [Vicinamibacterales bacterium]